MGKPHYYQKVIICPWHRVILSLSMAAQFLRCQSILFWFQQRKFCITEGVLFGFSGAVLERPKSPFH